VVHSADEQMNLKGLWKCDTKSDPVISSIGIRDCRPLQEYGLEECVSGMDEGNAKMLDTG